MVATNGARPTTEQRTEIANVRRDYGSLTSYANFFLRPQDAKILAKGNGKKLHEIYRDVAKDARIYAALTQRFGAAIGREIVVEAASDRRIDKKAADEVRAQIKALGKRNQERSNNSAVYSFGGFENATLTFLDARYIGYSIVEIDWAIEGDRVIARQLWSRDSSRFTFDIADGGWELRLLTLESPLNGIKLPPRKFLVTCVNSHDDSPYGDGLANKLFWLSWLKRQIQKWWAIFCDKHGSPTLKGEYDTPNQRDRLLEVMQNISQQAGVALPRGVTLDLLQASSTGTDVYSAFCGYCDTQAVEAILLQNLTTNITGGSYAASETHLEIREELVDSDVAMLSDGPYKDLSEWITAFNYPDAEPPLIYRPRLKVIDEARARRDTALVSLVGRPLTEEYIRSSYDAQFLSEEELAKKQEEQAAKEAELAGATFAGEDSPAKLASQNAPPEDPNAEQPFVFSETLDFKTAPSPSKKQKNCVKGIPCKGQCINANKKCRTEVTGEAAKAADYLEAKVPAVLAKPTPKTRVTARSEPKSAGTTEPNVPSKANTQAALKASPTGATTTEAERLDFQKQLKAERNQGLLANGKKLVKKLPDAPPPHPEEIAALQAYSGLYYRGVNRLLRGDTADLSPKQIQTLNNHIKFTTAAIDALPAYSGAVYRGAALPQGTINKYKVGETIAEKAFLSTSANPNVASGFTDPGSKSEHKPVSYTIKSKSGKDISKLSVLEKEQEILFRPDTQFKVLGKKTKNGVVHIYLEEV